MTYVMEIREAYIRHHIESNPYLTLKKNFDVITTKRVRVVYDTFLRFPLDHTFV